MVIATALAAPLAWAQSADLAVSKSGPAEAAAGSNVSYTVTVFNAGPDTALSITLTDPIPPGMTFVSATPPGCSTPAPGSGGTITCTIASLAAFTSTDFTFVFNIPSATPPGTFFTNIATATSATDPNSENDSGIAVTSTPPLPQADLSISKTGAGSAGPDTDVAFTIAVTNAGPDAASGVSWQDTLPGTMTFVSLVPTGGPAMSCTTPAPGSGGTITCTAVSFAAGATATFALTGHIPRDTLSETTFTNTVTVSATTADPNTENSTDTTSVTVSTPATIPTLSPSTFALLGIALAVVGFFVLRRRPSTTAR